MMFLIATFLLGGCMLLVLQLLDILMRKLWRKLHGKGFYRDVRADGLNGIIH